MKILATVLLVITLLGSLLMYAKCSNQAAELEKVETMPGGSMLKSLMPDMPSAASFNLGGYISIGLILASVFGAVAAFMKSKMIGFAGAGAVGLFSLLLIILVPGIDPGPYGGVNPKTLAMIIGGLGIVSAGILAMVASKRTA